MTLRYLPGVPYAASPRTAQYGPGLTQPPRLVVIHDTGNPTSNRFGEANYAATRTDPRTEWTSAHAYIDAGGVLGSLPLDLQAWAAYGYANRNGWHLELCLPGDRELTRRRAAEVTRQLCLAAGIPMVKLSPTQVAAGERGVCGHLDITIGLGVGNHIDPGKDFPWPQFMSWVNTDTNNTEESGMADSQREINTDQTLFAIGQLKPIAEHVTVVGYSDADHRMELPLVDLLTDLLARVKAIESAVVPSIPVQAGAEASAKRVTGATEL